MSFENIDVEKVLAALGMKFKRQGGELYALCINPKHQEKHPSWHIRAETWVEGNGLYNCWSCGCKGNLLQLANEKLHATNGEGEKFLKGFALERSEEDEDIDYLRGMESSEPREIDLEWKDELIHTEEIVRGCLAFDYLKSRWIGEQYIKSEGLLDWVDRQRIIIPIKRNGRLISWVARTYANENPKTLAPKGAPKKWELLGFDELRTDVKEVNLCEGWVDRIRLMQIGVLNVLALCGSRMSEHQAAEIMFARKVCVWQDGDLAGQTFSKQVVSWLSGRDIRIVVFPEGRDPGSYRPIELAEFQQELFASSQKGVFNA